MKTLYLDCFAGISGDMMIGLLLDLGLDLAVLERELGKLPLDNYRLQSTQVNKSGIQATKFQVILEGPDGERPADSEFQEVSPHEASSGEIEHTEDDAGQHHHHHHHHRREGSTHHDAHRSLAEILTLIDNSSLTSRVKATARNIFNRLGAAEAQVHGIPVDEVHFHEVGSVDAIIDIVGAAIGLEQLGIEQLFASPLHLGSGFVRCAHGLYPVPAPATANLVAGVPVYTTEAKGELVTPTGAAIITTVADRFGPMPQMMTRIVGYGAGSRDREFPNVLRGHLGEVVSEPEDTPLDSRAPFPEQHTAAPGPGGYHEGPAVIIEANIDDMNPQLFGNLVEQLLSANALDVVLIPVQMKKSRPGTLLQVLAHPSAVDDLLAIIFTESTSIGARTYEVTKHMLQRVTHTVETPFGPVRVKLAQLKDQVVNIAPEYEDCRQLARRHKVPVKEIYDAARTAFFQSED